MAHDVFISYSSKDKTVADAACSMLEQRQIRCWVAPRDVLPGVQYGGAIVDAIHSSRVLVLILSSHSNQSTHVMREVERAASAGLAILPFRLEDVPLSRDMEFFVSDRHWLDAITPPLEQHLHKLADTVRSLLDGGIIPTGPESHSPEIPDGIFPTGETVGTHTEEGADRHVAVSKAPSQVAVLDVEPSTPPDRVSTSVPAHPPERNGAITEVETIHAVEAPPAPQFAGFGRRLGSALTDLVLMFLILVAPVTVIGAYGYALGFIGIWAYSVLLESSQRRATVGKMLFGLEVTDMSGKRITRMRATVRCLAKFLSYFGLSLPFWTILGTPKKQAVHDLIADTIVVRSAL